MFFPSSRFDFIARLEDAWQLILQECLALPHDEFIAWPERQLYCGAWDVYGLLAAQQLILENCIFCPHTCAVLRQLPGVQNAGFSRLAAGCRIRAHRGYSSAVLRLHLGLQSAPAAQLRVGQEVRGWQAGRCLVFDDTLEHEAWNDSAIDRLVLLVDFLKPERMPP